MATPLSAIAKIQKKVWDGSLPLEIRLANADCRTYDETDPYLADVIRNGKGNVYMGLSKNDSDVLWEAVKTRKFRCATKTDNLQRFNTINNKLLNPPGTPLRNIPMKIYLPTAPSIINPEEGGDSTIQASIRTVQSLVAPFSGTRQPNTLGMALNQILPTVFPSRRNPVLATPVLHGAVVPMGAPVEELMRAAAFADGFLHIVVVML
ncbi:unnamed protein product [Aureobasidium pullulans]|nr:unnamed protein product [Aureobasidium pullulans]